jgi:hypothetical protein
MAVLQGNGPTSQITFELVRGRMTIGRKPENDIALEWDKAVSRRHAELELVAGSWFVSDLDSANGTFVNGTKVDRKRALHTGDELRIGDTTLRMGGLIPSEPFSDTAPSAKPPELTRKQSEVLRELCRPQARDPRAPCSTVKDIAARMYVGEAAVKAHLSALYVEFDVPEAGQQRRAMLAQKAWDRGAVRQTDYDDNDRDETN